ncbi:HD domain-containing protein [Elizabethkingia meningoseptica]|uniref:Phosphohydrolase n=1 Tax=Elizabethkingia meningoseptica TaxID=238 RepID=A0A1V3TX91_ELIME|nr:MULTISPECIES: HD domain-containing protein [Elizabethkingia]AQX04929.1 phosphohydrolase [Elizabethkingia meningoseptica]AQX12386.1 phosphohydrolase [Elizabethkingia meningoseptica]AQX46971.1 phosphohydrolase [Elizabethkingia meningoseptica]EJK5329574.1 HD domain-containing protein [Elizabethkingia meningoseptica]EOR30169.1 HD domain protein [Elizabethkingia meningoseptica ATCC 13253 = NBRC 12535]
MSDLISKTIEFVKKKLEGAEAGHDWFHIERVWKLSKKIAEKETCNQEVVELGALLHDIADPKFHNGDENIGPDTAKAFLKAENVDEDTIQKVVFIIKNISFKNRNEAPEEKPVELQIVQDADRLDAIGAIGIARVFNFGGFKNNPIHIPGQEPRLNQSKEEYKKSNGTTINHFYEKLLLLEGLMNTETGKRMASIRHEYMEDFLKQFYNEWDAVI